MSEKASFFRMKRHEANPAKNNQNHKNIARLSGGFAGFELQKSMEMAEINDYKKCKKSCKKGLHFGKKVI